MIYYLNLGRYGRLGNQMFQYASLMGIADKNNCSGYAPLSNSILPQGFILGSVKDEPPSENQLLHTKQRFAFTPEYFKIHENFDMNVVDVNLCGYFQTEKYFNHIQDRVKSDFEFKQNIRDTCCDIFNQLDPSVPIVSLHVRRGDYLIIPDIHPTTTDEYYEQALNMFPEHNVMVFSDDISWCKEKFRGSKFIFPKAPSLFHDLCLMTMCSSSIIANSSFSWWGAWLTNKEKVVAPKNWFGPSGPPSHDIYCDDWIII